jgi:hypothetical protein
MMIHFWLVGINFIFTIEGHPLLVLSDWLMVFHFFFNTVSVHLVWTLIVDLFIYFL